MSIVLRNSDGRPWYKEPWPWILAAGPGAVVLAGFVTLWLAVVSNDGLVSDDYYKQGLAVNKQLQRDQQAKDLGVQAEVMLAGQNLRLILTADQATALPSLLNIKLMHPTRAGQDHLAKVLQDAPGFYEGKLDVAVTGRWHLSIEDPAGQWRLQGDWQADTGEALHLGGGK